MTEVIDSVSTDAAVRAWQESIALTTECVPGAYIRLGAMGTRLHFTTLPIPELNAVCVDHDRDLGEVDAFAAELSEHGLPWTIQVRGEVDLDLLRLAARHGRTATSTLPLNLWHLESPPVGNPHRVTVREVPGDAEVREVSEAQAAVFSAALAAGFEMPREFADLMCPPALLADPGVTGFLLSLKGEAVATGINFVVGDHVAMFGGSVSPQHRRNGYYRTLVTARLAHAVAHGARHAVVQNTPASRPLYESLGFRLAETWTYLGSAE
jgi:ribosomal protein S18 acetylase RimI-like enzyme